MPQGLLPKGETFKSISRSGSSEVRPAGRAATARWCCGWSGTFAAVVRRGVFR